MSCSSRAACRSSPPRRSASCQRSGGRTSTRFRRCRARPQASRDSSVRRAVVADSLAGRARDRPPRVCRAAGEDGAAAEARHPGIGARAGLVCRRVLRRFSERPATGFSDFQDRLRLASPVDARRRGGRAELRPAARVVRRGPLYVEGMTTVPDSKPMPWGPPPPPPPRGVSVSRSCGSSARTTSRQATFAALGAADAPGPGLHRAPTAPAHRASRSSTRRWRRARSGSRARSAAGSRSASPGAFDIEIVGVVRDLRYEHLREAAPDGIFFPLAQIPRGEDERQDRHRRDRADRPDAHPARAEGERMTRDGCCSTRSSSIPASSSTES